jgi:glucokinase
MKPEAVIAVDLGGTNLRLGLVSAAGKILMRRRAGMTVRRSKRELLEDLFTAIDGFMAGASGRRRIRAVSLGFAGYTDSRRGLVYFAPNVGGFRNIGVAPYLERRLRIPVFVENDANCAALGEYWKGAGRGVGSLFLFTLGTGVGGGFIVRGEIWRGAAGTAGEVGHTIVMAGGPPCTCGNRGCLEAFASATAIVKEYRRRKKARATGGSRIDAKHVTDLARQGDRAALGALDYAAGGLGLGIANVFNLLNPELILIGGGVSRAGSILLRPAVRKAKSIVFPALAPKLKVKRAALGDDAALLGAARLAFSLPQKLKNRGQA